jgi:hypothetical protein
VRTEAARAFSAVHLRARLAAPNPHAHRRARHAAPPRPYAPADSVRLPAPRSPGVRSPRGATGRVAVLALRGGRRDGGARCPARGCRAAGWRVGPLRRRSPCPPRRCRGCSGSSMRTGRRPWVAQDVQTPRRTARSRRSPQSRQSACEAPPARAVVVCVRAPHG